MTPEGEGYCWGWDGRNGNLGRAFWEAWVDEFLSGNLEPVDYSSEPLPVSGDLRFVNISTGWDHTCGLGTDGLVYCWGDRESSGTWAHDWTVKGIPALILGQQMDNVGPETSIRN